MPSPPTGVDRARLDLLFGAAPVGLGLWDRDLRFLWVNDGLAAINGMPASDHVGRRLEDVVPDVGPRAASVLREVLASGEALSRLVEGETPAQPGVTRWWTATYYPAFGDDGAIAGVGAVVSEVTERLRAEEALARVHSRTQLQAAASRLLEATLEYEETLEQVVRLLVPDLADWAFVELLEPDGSIRRAAIAADDPETERWLREMDERYPLDPASPVGSPQVIRSGVPVMIPAFPEELLERAAIDAEHLDILRRVGMESAIIVPLRARGKTFGDLALAMAGSGRSYGPEDLALAEELADRCAMAVDNARLYEQQTYVARTLQQAMLPAQLPDIAGLEVAAQYRAAVGGTDVGGDFYDVYASPSGWQFLVGDVAGKGPLAAASTGLVRHTVRAMARYERSPAAVLRAVNEVLLEQLSEDAFCTVALVEVDARTGRATIACGGHPPPFLVSDDGTVREVGVPGQLLGAVHDAEITDAEVDLGRGDTLLLYTDGLTEARERGAPLGEERVRALIGMFAGLGPSDLTSRVLRAVSAFQDVQRDDIAMVALRVTPERRRVPRDRA